MYFIGKGVTTIHTNGLWVTKIIYSPFFFDWIFAHNACKRNTKPTAAPGNTIAKCRERVQQMVATPPASLNEYLTQPQQVNCKATIITRSHHSAHVVNPTCTQDEWVVLAHNKVVAVLQTGALSQSKQISLFKINFNYWNKLKIFGILYLWIIPLRWHYNSTIYKKWKHYLLQGW